MCPPSRDPPCLQVAAVGIGQALEITVMIDLAVAQSTPLSNSSLASGGSFIEMAQATSRPTISRVLCPAMHSHVDIYSIVLRFC